MKTKKSNEFKVKFGGELNLVDLHTFISSLSNMATVVEEINASMHTNKVIEMKLKTLEPGSFIAGITLKEIEQTQSSVFEQNDDNITSKIITRLAGLNEFKKHIGAGAIEIVEQTDQQVTIQNKRGDKKIFDRSIYDLYTSNEATANAISNNYSVLEGDPAVTSFELLDSDNEPIFKADRQEFEELAVQAVEETNEKKIKTETAELRIHKLVFDPKYKWEFWYKGTKISANIHDEEFFEGIDKDEKFGKGDLLKVELQTTSVFDPSVDIFTIDSYTVTKVIEHIPKEIARQLSLDDFSK